jgi:N-formylglutamate amidohydrolase
LTQQHFVGSLVAMQHFPPDPDDSRLVDGGHIPGQPDHPAFSLRYFDPSPIPVVIAVPHAGRSYAHSLLERMRHPAFATPRLEDRYVDLLATRVAAETRAALLVAHAPRAMVDLNRAADDVDWEMMNQPLSDASGDRACTAEPGRERGWSVKVGTMARARSGLGLIPRRLPGLGELWKRRFEHHELDDRIAGVHQPYHAALGDMLLRVRQRWGSVLLIDMHSMPPLPPPNGAERAPEFVVGDRFGAACGGELIGAAFSHFAQERRQVAHNRPYAGGYVLDRHARRGEGIHCLQLEIDRRLYLEPRLVEPGEGFEDTVRLLTGLVQKLASVAAELGGEAGSARWRMAAE